MASGRVGANEFNEMQTIEETLPLVAVSVDNVGKDVPYARACVLDVVSSTTN